MRGNLQLDGQVFAVVSVEQADDLFSGTIDVLSLSSEHEELFAQYERAVLAQLFHEVDRLAAEIDILKIRFFSDNSTASVVRDLQLYPLQMTVSFMLWT